VAIGVSTLAFFAGSSVMADQPTAKIYLNGAAIGGSLDGIYTSPYQAQINDVPIEVPVICDDFANNSYIPETWTAYLTTVAEINTGTYTPSQLKWGNADSDGEIVVGGTHYAGWNLDQKLAYNVAAYLAIRIMQTSVPAATLASEQYSYAMWELFDANDHSISQYPDQPPPIDTVVDWLTTQYHDVTTLSAATADVEDAIDTVCGGPTHPNCVTSNGVTSVTGTPIALVGYDVNIYTYASCISGLCMQTSPPNPPQEFITVSKSVPESSSLAALAGYLLFGGLSLLLFRRRRRVTA
jgi:LPXTG-motif cell wall-anchored protein